MPINPSEPTWTPGPPTEEGSYWVFLPEYGGVEHVEVLDIFGRIRMVLPGQEMAILITEASHHIPLTKPEPPAQPSEDPE
jgi:hypothetical protein